VRKTDYNRSGLSWLFFILSASKCSGMKYSQYLKTFFESEKAGGISLIVCTVVSLLLANMSSTYVSFWHLNLGSHDVVHWINDGLMAIFFLLVSLELKREFLVGELSNLKRAVTPLMAAFGGVAVPALIYYLINVKGGDTRGLGIPMATDIVFALGVLSLLGSRVPFSLKVFLTALAVIDDLCAILVIAIFYSQTIHLGSLAIAVGIFMVLLVLNRLKVQSMIVYLLVGIALWYFMLHSGVHAAISGVLVALAVPFSKSSGDSLSHKLEHLLHKPVTFFILPVFALANTSIELSANIINSLLHPISIGIILGLMIGKPLGILGLSYFTVRTGMGSLALDVKWKHIFGIGLFGGIGFTISIFISLLAFDVPDIIDLSKISVLIASFLSGILGYVYMQKILVKK
jgi:NhaA family Na+:H+ antiporter